MTGEYVYLPSDDTFLLLKFLSNIGAADFSCEIGSGSGIVTEALANISQRVLAVDISPKACKVSWEKVRKRPDVDVICCDSLSAIREDKLFSFVVTNPPYLPFKDGSYLWSGGEGGIEVAQKFTFDALRRLKEGGRMVIVLSSLSDVKGYMNSLSERGVKVNTVIKEGVGLFEELYIIEIRMEKKYV
ncbi:MAG TPA: methyltransferase domain-containing protein [Thermofilum sp.]|nr:methyltransferase domain-containing protein [Thermofilum sp.]